MFNRIIFAFFGSSNEGKTTAIESINKVLKTKGYNIATVKHISKSEFSIDSPGKDTWRFAQSGSNIILGISAKEIAIIKKIETQQLSLAQIIAEIPLDSDGYPG